MELNEKLLKFAGFTYQELTYDRGIKGMGWCYPNGERVIRVRGDKGIDFPTSLDACFKWLIPEIDKRYGYAVLFKILLTWISALQDYDKAADDFCKIIEQLIDKEGAP